MGVRGRDEDEEGGEGCRHGREPPPSRDNMSGGSPLQERTNLLRAEEDDDDVRMVQTKTKTTSRSKKKEEGEDRECRVQDAASRAKEVVEGKTWSEKRVRSACDGLTSALANREAGEEGKQTLPVGSQAREALLGYLNAALRVEEREIGRRKLSEESLSSAWRAASAGRGAGHGAVGPVDPPAQAVRGQVRPRFVLPQEGDGRRVRLGVRRGPGRSGILGGGEDGKRYGGGRDLLPSSSSGPPGFVCAWSAPMRHGFRRR